MNWNKTSDIDLSGFDEEEGLGLRECLCRNSHGYYLVGYLCYDPYQEMFSCSAEGVEMSDVTHYILTNVLEKQFEPSRQPCPQCQGGGCPFCMGYGFIQ